MFDFSQASIGNLTELGGLAALPGDHTNLGGIALMPGGILAGAFVFNSDGLGGGEWALSTLMTRNAGPDHVGLGVCSEGLAECAAGGTGFGDPNALSQSGRLEAIVLMRPENTEWTNLWVSSFYGERGSMYWADENENLLGGFVFASTGALGSLPLPSNFDPNALFIILYPGAELGESVDYLVWGADLRDRPSTNALAVPEPGALFLLGTGLCALAERRRRAKRQQIATRS